ncbi:response regulator [Rhodovulum tesquicola]|uniref:response regulator n=1 Tax=Rhodovulum tesquicola TaxID=540254 RepID=UPI002097A3F9|nr:response regulator [Rhodovulum tesquicola]MCO8146590.1 response regulator [Rhodovulum tesquicola]
MLGHDIRAAISDILGGLALADLSVLDPTSRLQLQRVQSSAEQLVRLTDETLALVTGDDSPRADPPVQTSLGPFLDRIAARWHAHAGARGLGFCLDRADDLPTAIGTDPAALERILSNMIANAVKYSPVGEVRLRVHLGPQEALCLRVRDTGPGFSEAAMARLFDFAGRPEDSGQPGTGLGLHIVRDLAQRIRGQIQVANAAEGGAEVSLILPRRAWAPGIEAPSAAADLPDLGGCSVLVAEDNPTNRLLVQQMLETLGAEVTLVEDGEEAAEALADRRFDLVLVDIEMPRLSGIDVIRRLRAAEGDGPASPVLAITAFVLSANRDQIYDAGADGILAKPILSLDAFGEAIARVLTKRTAPLSGTTTGVPFDPVHLDRLLALAGPEDGRELLRRMREDFGTVKGGLAEGQARGDLALIRSRTHVLISLAGALGNVALQAEAEALNAAALTQDRATVAGLLPRVMQAVDALRTAIGGELDTRFAAEAAG